MMKKIFFSLTISLLLFSCNSIEEQNIIKSNIQTETSSLGKITAGYEASQEKADLAFSNLLRSVNYCPGGDGSCIPIAKAFIEKSGFPSERFAIDAWEVSWEEADAMYQDFYKLNEGKKYINAFRWHASQIVLADLSLLGEGNSKHIDKIAFYTQEMIDAGSDNLDFLNYCLVLLSDTKYQKNIKQWANTALHNFENGNTKALEQIYNQLKQLEREGKADARQLLVIQTLEEYLDKKLKAKEYIQKTAS